MDKQDYIDSLKQLNLRPKKVKVEHKEHIIMEADKGEPAIHDKIIKWFMENPYPEDSQVHKFAENIGVEHDDLEKHIYMILSEIISEGRSKEYKGSYDPKELALGIEIELEHTPNRMIAEKIAKDHLAEIKDYYTRLKKMEKEAGILKEIFIQSSEISTIPSGKERDMQICRLGIIAELDASNLYENLAGLAQDKKLSKVLRDVSEEEKVHVGEFESLLNIIDPEHEKAVEEGEDEVKDI